ncbi:MAG: hypothetical protein DRH17_01880 [Deltaproteobacteria bacterium]|nr:MAG: hypothetical protein DRH17_01880 [Deltaproteobacteria bacterium]
MIVQENRPLYNRKFAILEPHSDFATNPSLMCLVEEFIKNGVNVDIFMPEDSNYHKIGNIVNVYPFPREFQFWFGSVKNTLYNWRWLLRGAYRGKKVLYNKKYDLVFGINSEGIISAYNYSKKNNTPLIYLSYEIFFRDELINDIEKKEKDIEVDASQHAQLIVIQDERRAELLGIENSIPNQKFVYLPVSPRSSKNLYKTDYLRNKFKIPTNNKIVLHSGSFDDWTYAKELLNNVPTWPKYFTLVIHTSHSSTKLSKYIKIAKNSKVDNVFFSFDPLGPKEYEQLVASADIGLVLYKETPHRKASHSRYLQKNIRNIGLSSGKFSYYMKYGLPIISIKQDTYGQLLGKYNFGYNISKPDEMAGALNNILSRYEYHSREAMRLFKEKLQFDLYWPNLSKRIIGILDA